MYKAKGIGRSKEEARRRAEEALKERLWRECWKSEVDVEAEEVGVVEYCGMFEVEIEI